MLLTDLPTELLELVVSNVPSKQRIRLCARLRDAVYTSTTTLRCRVASIEPHMAMLLKCAGLTHLVIAKSHVCDLALTASSSASAASRAWPSSRR